MKLNRWDRLCVIICAALTGVLLAFVFICTLAPDAARATGEAFGAALAGSVALRVLLISLCLALAAFIASRVRALAKGEEKDDASPAPALSLSDGEGGSVRVSEAALEALVRRSVGVIEGVEKFDVKLMQGADALSVTLEAKVRQGVKIPDLAQAAQNNVRRALGEMAGVKVDAVALLVTDILSDAEQASKEKEKA